MKGRKPFPKSTKRILFDKLKKIDGYNPKIWRQDNYGKTICYPSYGDVNSSYGWNIHHINHNPRDNSIDNLIALSFDSHEILHTKEA